MALDKQAPIESAPLVWRDAPDPTPAAGEVRVRVSCCGVCRTDLHVVEGDLPSRKLPLIPGHQVVGVIDQVGKGCCRLEAGQRVGVAWLRRACGGCGYCSSDRENLCENSEYTGYTADGGYAEHVVAPEAFVYEVPSDYSDMEAAPLLCAGIIGYRALRRSRLPQGGKLAIFGFGSSAHVVIQIARHRGCQIYVVTRSAGHQKLALELGAAWAGGDAADMPEETDSAILFAPAGELVPAALKHLRKGGTLALAGIHVSDVPKLNYQDHLFYERDLRSVTSNTREDGRELLAEAAQAGVRPRVTTYPLQDANQALADLKQDRINGAGVLVVRTAT